MITFDEFVEKFDPVRNKFDSTAPIENMMFEPSEEEQMDYVESVDPTLVWSFSPRKNGLVNGIVYRQEFIGYLICKNPCMFKPNEIFVTL